MHRTEKLPTIILAAAGAFTAWRGASYVLHLGNVQRHHVESAWFVLAAIAIGAAALRVRGPDEQEARVTAAPRLAWLPLWWLAAIALYFPVARLGLFSDDFVLLAHARDADFLSPDLAFVRPLLLAVWWGLDRVLPAGSVGIGLHALTMICHGTNAFLLTRVAGRLGRHAGASAAIGALFLTFPLNVEAMTWPSAMGDVVLLTEWLVAMELVSMAGLWAACGVVLVSLAALATKETAVIIGPALALLLLIVPRSRTRTTIAAVGATVVAALIYAAMRLYVGVPDSHRTLPSGYAMKELLVRPFATLGLPFHDALVPALMPISAIIAVALAAGVAISACRWHRRSAAFRLVIACCLWISLSVVPVFTAFYVNPDLQGSRYLYVASAFWALLIYVLARETLKAESWASAMCVLLAIGSIAIVREQQQPWRQAAALRDVVLQELDRVSGPCSTVQVTNVPDSVAGAFVFRNGFAEAVADHIPRLRVTRDGAPPECRFDWNGSSLTGGSGR